MAISFSHAISYGINDGGSDTRVSDDDLIVSAGDTVVLIVGSSDGAPVAPDGVTLDPGGTPQAFALADGTTPINHGTYGEASCWVLKNAAACTAPIEVSFPSPQGEFVMVALAYPGVDAAEPIAAAAQDDGEDFTPTAPIGTAAEDFLVVLAHWLYINNASISFNSPSGTERAEVTTTPDFYDGAAGQDQVAAGGPTTSPSWSLSTTPTSWAMFVLKLQPAGEGGGGDGGGPLIGGLTRSTLTQGRLTA